MNDALYIAATGMRAQSTQLDAIANNVTNMATPQYKRAAVRFGDLVSQAPPVDGAEAGLRAADTQAAQAMQLAGVMAGSLRHSFAAGELRRSDDPMQLAIQGDGFLEVLLADGRSAYTRGGRLQVNGEGLLSTADGQVLRQRIQVPTEARELLIAEDGAVQARDADGRQWSLGRLDLVLFANPSALSPLGAGLWAATGSAGDPQQMPAAEAGAGRLRQAHVEGSNVQMVDEMVQLMVAQRAYEMSVKVMQAADEVAAMTNNLRK